MNRASSAVLMAALLVFMLASCVSAPFKGETIVSPRFKPEIKSIALHCEVTNPNAMHLWYMPHLTQALIRNGYRVIERLQFETVLKELELDQTRYIGKKGKKKEGEEKEEEETILGTFTPARLKKIGQMYGVNYLGVYGQWPNNRIYFRIVDCETAEVVATTVFSIPSYIDPFSGAEYKPSERLFTRNTADLVILSLKYASQVKDENGNPRMVFLDISSNKRKEGKADCIDQILFQKDIGDGATHLYAVISTKDNEMVGN